MFLMKDYLSIWELAHRWHDADPNMSDPTKLLLPIQDTIRTLAFALAQDELHVLNAHGVMAWNWKDIPSREEFIPSALMKINVDEELIQEDESDTVTKGSMTFEKMTCEEAGISDEDIDADEEYEKFIDIKLRKHRAAVEKIYDAYKTRTYNKANLDDVYLDKLEIYQFSKQNGITPPAFWYSKMEMEGYETRGNKAADENEKKLRPNQLDRELCRAIAMTLWQEHPDMNIAHMCRHHAIQTYGNGKQYREKTLREWIADLDPRPDGKKGGRPSKNT